MRKLTAPTKRPIRLAPIRPNAGLTAKYQAALDRTIAEMQRSILYHVRAAYRRNPPEMAADESPAAGLQAMMARLGRQWTARFADLAATWGPRFGKDAVGNTDRSFAAALKKAGFTVQFRMTPAANDIMRATIAEQVGLIKSIPEQYLTQVQGAVMRSVALGGDLGTLAAEIEHQYGVTKRRAALIARSQNAIATASITKARQLEIGITQAIWLHSAGGKQPRPSHVKAGRDKTRYDVAKGWYDPDEGNFIHPGQLVNCRCVSISVIDGLE
jgi:uncharacterized protein with gpF-like domain